ncbi:MAG TPA: hypothetical protein VFJ14_09825 [Nocardioidaceae bacterium]|nr:hypothetical protein [Nocardioidaceae bacterium]
MSKLLMVQVLASIGALVGIAIVYAGLQEELGVLATVGFVLFGVSLLVTPVIRLAPRRGAGDET